MRLWAPMSASIERSLWTRTINRLINDRPERGRFKYYCQKLECCWIYGPTSTFVSSYYLELRRCILRKTITNKTWDCSDEKHHIVKRLVVWAWPSRNISF